MPKWSKATLASLAILLIIFYFAKGYSSSHSASENIQREFVKLNDESSSLSSTSRNRNNNKYVDTAKSDKINEPLAIELNKREIARTKFLFKKEREDGIDYYFTIKAASSNERANIEQIISKATGVTTIEGVISDWRDRLTSDYLWVNGFEEYTMVLRYYTISNQWQYSAGAETLTNEANTFKYTPVKLSTCLADKGEWRFVETIKLLPIEDQKLFMRTIGEKSAD